MFLFKYLSFDRSSSFQWVFQHFGCLFVLYWYLNRMIEFRFHGTKYPISDYFRKNLEIDDNKWFAMWFAVNNNDYKCDTVCVIQRNVNQTFRILSLEVAHKLQNELKFNIREYFCSITILLNRKFSKNSPN